ALAGLVAATLGDDVHAVVVAEVEPPLTLAGHPHVGGGPRLVAGGIGGRRAQDEVALGRRLDLAVEQAGAVGPAPAQRTEPIDLAHRFPGIESADKPLAVTVHGAPEGLDEDIGIDQRRTGGVDGDDGEGEAVARYRPAV